FVFSSRGRHTRSKRDWSSDVCSSDLGQGRAERSGCGRSDQREGLITVGFGDEGEAGGEGEGEGKDDREECGHRQRAAGSCGCQEIGRASCRERVEIAECAGGEYKTKA